MGSKKWWLQEEENSNVYLYRLQNGKKSRFCNKKSGREFGPIVSISVFTDKPDALKFKFRGEDAEKGFRFILERRFFEWNKSPFSKNFREACTAEEMVTIFNNLKGEDVDKSTSSSSDMEVDLNVSSGGSTTSSDCSSPHSSSDATPPREKVVKPQKRKLSNETKSVSAVSLKKGRTDNEKPSLQAKVQHAFCGHFLINIRALESGNHQIREEDPVFLTNLVKSMQVYRDEAYQPVCLLVKALTNRTQFDKAKVNGYEYDVIGGNHTLQATKELAKRHPNEEKYKSLNCVVYAGLGEEEKQWLGVRHNKTGEFRHVLSFKEKVAICHNSRAAMPTGMTNADWKESCRIILNEEKLNQDTDLACMIASYDDSTYELFMQMFELYEEGDLKDQKLSMKDRLCKPDIKPYRFKHFRTLDQQCVQSLLQDVVEQNISLEEMTSESKTLTKLRSIQRAFVQLMNCKDWEEAVEQYPEETSRGNLIRFATLSFTNIPEPFVNYCQRLMKRRAAEAEKSSQSMSFTGKGSSKGFVFLADVLQLNPHKLQEHGVSCDGFELVVVDLPYDWTAEDVKELTIVVKNINTQINNFRLIILCEVSKLSMVKETLHAAKCFQKVEEAFYYLENTKKVSKVTMTPAVKSFVVGYGSETARITSDQVSVSGGHNFWSLSTEMPIKDGDGQVVCSEQKPLALFEVIISNFTHKGAWMLDGTCGAGNGLVAALTNSVNVVGIDTVEKNINICQVRCESLVGALCCDEDFD